MTLEQLDQVVAALAHHEQATAAANQQLFTEIRAVPGGEVLLRRFFAEAKLDAAAVERIMAGRPEPADAALLFTFKLNRPTS